MAKRRVLLVEPDAELASMVERFLGRADFEVSIARDGLLGFKLATDIDPQVVLVDLKLDGQREGGYLLGKSFRQDTALSKIPMVLMVPESFDEEKPDKVKAINKIFDGLLYKPFADTELKRVVENFTGFGEPDGARLKSLDNLFKQNGDLAEDTDLSNLVRGLKDQTAAELSLDSVEKFTARIKQMEAEVKDREAIIKERDRRIENLMAQASEMEFDHSLALETIENEKAELQNKLHEITELLKKAISVIKNNEPKPDK